MPLSFCKYVEVNSCSYMQHAHSNTVSATLTVAIDACDVFENLSCNFCLGFFCFFVFLDEGEKTIGEIRAVQNGHREGETS